MALIYADPAAQLNFLHYLDLPGLQLSSLRVNPPRNMFPLADKEPQFFSNNLVSPNRSIRQLLNVHTSALRVFYYQLLKLCFQLDSLQSKLALQHLKNTVYAREFDLRVSPIEFSLTNGIASRLLHNPDQLKKLLAEFIQLLSNEFYADCQETVNSHPIIDHILVDVLATVLQRRGVKLEEFTNNQVVFRQLSEEFGLSVTQFGDCYRFQDSDIFCYQELSTRILYLAFMDTSFIVQHSRFPELRQVVSVVERQELEPIEQREGSESGTKNTLGSSTPFLYSVSNFNDTSLPIEQRTNPTHRRTTSILMTGTVVEQQEEQEQPYALSSQSLERQQTSSVLVRQFVSDSPQMRQLDNSFERMKGELDERMASTATQASQKTLNRCLATQCELVELPKTTEKGDYYDDFTKTFLLEVIEEPFRSNIRRVKDNIRGMRKPVAGLAYQSVNCRY